MKPTEDLFVLVKSLTRAERAYFRKYANWHVLGGKNNYLILFDAIDKQKTYDERKLIEALKETAFVRHIHVVKNYLFNLILDSLSNISTHKFEEQKIYSRIVRIGILMDKGLHKSALKMTKKTKGLAVSGSKEYLMFKLLDLETGLILYADISKQTELELEKIINSKRLFGEQLMIKSELKNLSDRQNLILKKRGNIRTARDEQAMSRIMANKLLELKNNGLPIDSVYFKQTIKLKYYAAKGEMDEYAKAAEELLNEFEKRDKLASLSFSMYFSVALHYLDYCVSFGLYEKFNNRLKDYLRLFRKSDPNKWERRYYAEHQITFSGIMLKYYDSMKQSDNFKETLKNADVLIDEYKEYLPPRRMLTMSISFAEMSFLNKMYDDTLHWLNRIINYPAHPAKDDIVEAALLLSIMTQYQTGNYESMIYSISNARKHLRSRDRLLETEKTILSFFRRIASITDKKKLAEEFTLLKNKMEKLKEMESERTFFERLRMVTWIESKLEELNKRG